MGMSGALPKPKALIAFALTLASGKGMSKLTQMESVWAPDKRQGALRLRQPLRPSHRPGVSVKVNEAKNKMQCSPPCAHIHLPAARTAGSCNVMDPVPETPVGVGGGIYLPELQDPIHEQL